MIEKKKYNFTAETPEKVVLVGIITPKQDETKVTEYLEELAFLAETAGAVTCHKFTQRLDHPHAKTYIGSGKIDEIKAYIDEQEIGTVIFDDELTPSQLRNLEKSLECKIVDRTNLILD
ncbi:MAG: GTPase HflX, partial [Prevotellaceae bacterium]|nr:GTPase HflX [Prevotellaceae bacterium]